MSTQRFNPHEASRTYASAGAVLAGFCFAAVVLILTFEQVAIAKLLHDDPAVFDRAIGALLTAFLGLVLSAFLMARLGGRPDPDEGNLWLALLASVGLVTSALFALWGLAELIGVVLNRPNVITLVRWVFVVTSILASAFVVAAALDLRGTQISPENRLGEALGLMAAAAIGGSLLLFPIGLMLAGVQVNDLPDTPIDLIAKTQLVGFAVLVLGALGLSASPSEAGPRWLRGWFGAAVTYFLVMLPPAVAWTLFFKLHEYTST